MGTNFCLTKEGKEETRKKEVRSISILILFFYYSKEIAVCASDFTEKTQYFD